eukprot:TRINITY_DN121425_c0_g1_i1.p1 TRINITY_DN121425_c0_g1~~TRINITY_DN121425_c0_g1_i1.p1  ORF type:complete len:391 (+),score=79.86 TRINITY_DN121425_c0_g1_i1:73-1245(+)
MSSGYSPETDAAMPAADAAGTADVDMDVPPPPAPYVPAPGEGPSERRRARVQLPEPDEDEGPTFYRLGVDHEFPEACEEIHVQCGRIKKLENLERAGSSLKNLMLIANCIEKIENLDSLVNLEHLELYQNLLKRIENINHLANLTVIDFSFNKIRSMAPLASCNFPKLDKLYLSSNKIDVWEGVFHFNHLKMLELGSNRIRDVPSELSQLTELEELWLGKNKITKMALAPLPNLKRLSMQSNRLEQWDSLLFSNCPNLEYLYLGHNNLPNLPDDFGTLTKLIEVDLAANAMTRIQGFPTMVQLKELWMNDCKVDDLAEIQNLSKFPALQALYLERNPMHGLGDEAREKLYKDAILAAVPDLAQLDAERLGFDVKIITDGSEQKVMGIRKR